MMAACFKHVLRLNGLKPIPIGIWSPRLNLSTLSYQSWGRVINPQNFNACRSSNRLLQRSHIIFASPTLYNSTDATDSITSTDATVNLSTTDATDCISITDASTAILSTDETASISSTDATVDFSSADATASISSSDAVETLSSDLPSGYIPEPPPLPTPPEEVLNALGEPTFASLGLGGYAPSGWVQSALETLHIGADLPWWGAIVIGTVFVRICMFPIVVIAQRNAAHMSNHMPTIVRLQQQFSEARTSGNPMDAARIGNELMSYMKRYKIKPFRNFLVPLAQMPVFISVFVGLRGMANLPVESMTTGGTLWFTDLTIVDPFYALPLLTTTTLLATIELGVDGVKTGTMTHTMKWVFRAMPIFLLPIISGFPSAMLCYWFTSNGFSLLQVLFLKIPVIRDGLKIPQIVKHDPTMMPKKKGFIEGFQESWNNAKVASQMEQRQKVDALKFKEAGLGPIQKTYAHNPKAITAKKQ